MHLIRDLGANLTDNFINKLKKKTQSLSVLLLFVAPYRPVPPPHLSKSRFITCRRALSKWSEVDLAESFL